MTKQETLITRKRRGPAPTGKGDLLGVRVQPDLMAALDAYIAATDPTMSRPEAMRRIVQYALENGNVR